MSVFSGPEIPNDGLVLQLDAANNRSYPGSGTTWYDLSNNSGNLALTNSPTFSSDSKGSFVFDGINDYAVLSNNQTADNLTAMTASVWVYANWSSPGGAYSPILTKISDASSGAGWELGSGWASPDVYFYTQNAGGTLYNAKSATVSAGSRWLNVVAGYSGGFGGTISIYVNGINMPLITRGSGSPASITTTSAITVASRNGANTFGVKYLPATVSLVHVYNRLLSASEIKQNFEAYRGRFGV